MDSQTQRRRIAPPRVDACVRPGVRRQGARRDRQGQIGDIICAFAVELIAGHGDEELHPIYNRNSNTDFDAEAEGENKAFKSMMEGFLGIDLGRLRGKPRPLESFREGRMSSVGIHMPTRSDAASLLPRVCRHCSCTQRLPALVRAPTARVLLA